MADNSASSWDDDHGRRKSLTPLEPIKKRYESQINNPLFNSNPMKANSTSQVTGLLNPQKLAILAGTGLFAVVSVAAVITTTVLYSNQVTTTSQADYLESCISKACIESKHLSCLNQTCQCDPTHYKWDSTYKKCIEALSSSTGGASHGDYCVSGVTTCGSKATCIESICKCDTSTQYWDGSSCQTKKTYLTSCTVRSKSNTSCLSDNECYECSNSSNLICNTTTLMCVCPTNYYYDSNSMKCLQTKSYFQNCNSSILCDTTRGLKCETTTSNVTDNCPIAINQCDCNTGYYFDVTTDKCQKKKPYQRSCTTSCECDDSDGLKCYNNMCLCQTNHYFNNVTCVSTAATAKLTFLDSCNVTTQCNTQVGLFCNSTLGKCACSYPYYWSSTSVSCVECPDGWVMLNLTPNVTRCYYFSITTMYFHDAWARCINSGANLIMIEDVNEWNIITNYRIPFGLYYYWIGIYIDYRDGGYFWLNGLQSSSWGYFPGNGCGNPSTYLYFTWYIGGGTSYTCNWYRMYSNSRYICKKNF